MCGILTILDLKADPETMRQKALKCVKRIRHRGPDWSGVFSDENAVLCHERLAIVDPESGAQPLIDIDTQRVLAVNGEIYNHKELEKGLRKKHSFQTKSDCEVLLYLYDELGPGFVAKISGIFAFVLYDPRKKAWLVARDHLGIVPLYIGWDREGQLYVASELKALQDVCYKIQEFPPGHYYESGRKKFVRYYKPKWAKKGKLPTAPADLKKLRRALEDAVRRQLMCDVPYGILVSGGLDSSVIAALAAKFSEKRVETGGKSRAWWPRIHSFSVGLLESPDLKAARKVAEHIGSVHHEIVYTVQEGMDAIPDVIHHLETFDVTTIRAATPMFLMARKIRAMGIKMILSGEGADEVFGGYLYFHKAPNPKEFHQETVRKLDQLHLYDCLRANKSTAAWGVEARVPFLDKEFLEVAMNINPAHKMVGKSGTKSGIEKYILRKAFEGLLPKEILWRQKEQFSDGVGYSWINSLKAHAEKTVTDQMMENASHRFPLKPPQTKEAYWYRSIFDEHFGAAAAELVPWGPSVACSTPVAMKWDKAFKKMVDPSGRAVAGVHQDSYKDSHKK